MADLFRVYTDVADDGYPAEWHMVKHIARANAGHRCVRCGHPYRCGEHGDGEWTPCAAGCEHDGPWRVTYPDGTQEVITAKFWHDGERFRYIFCEGPYSRIEAQWRILTVHHLDGDKTNCRWWNLAALCQRCHLTIQGRVQMARVWPWEHTDWFKPYVAGYYAHVYLGEDLTRAEIDARLDELLALERQA